MDFDETAAILNMEFGTSTSLKFSKMRIAARLFHEAQSYKKSPYPVVRALVCISFLT